MQPLKIAAGTKVFLGVPATPMAQDISVLIGETVNSVPGVLEAHLPQCFAVGVMQAPAQVLVIVIEPKASIRPLLELLSSRLAKILPEGMHLDVWPIDSAHPSLATVRSANCQVF